MCVLTENHYIKNITEDISEYFLIGLYKSLEDFFQLLFVISQVHAKIQSLSAESVVILAGLHTMYQWLCSATYLPAITLATFKIIIIVCSLCCLLPRRTEGCQDKQRVSSVFTFDQI